MNVWQEELHYSIPKPASYRAYGPACPLKTFLRVFEQSVAFNSHLSWQIQAHFLWLLCYGMEVCLDSLLLSPKWSLFARLWVSVAPPCTYQRTGALFTSVAYSDHSSSKSFMSKLHFIFVTLVWPFKSKRFQSESKGEINRSSTLWCFHALEVSLIPCIKNRSVSRWMGLRWGALCGFDLPQTNVHGNSLWLCHSHAVVKYWQFSWLAS